MHIFDRRVQVIEAALRIDRCLPHVSTGEDRALDEARRLLKRLRTVVAWQPDAITLTVPVGPVGAVRVVLAGRRATVSRRTRYATGIAIRLLPPADRARYRQEFAAELADLPRIDQGPYAFRLVTRAWWLRRELKGKKTSASAGVTTLVLATGGSIAFQIAIGWPAAILGGVAIFALMWTINSADRTKRLATLIRSARGGSGSKQKK